MEMNAIGEIATAQLRDIGSAIRAARLQQKSSQADVSARSAISVSTLKRLEGGDPHVAAGFYFQVMALLLPNHQVLSAAIDRAPSNARGRRKAAPGKKLVDMLPELL